MTTRLNTELVLEGAILLGLPDVRPRQTSDVDPTTVFAASHVVHARVRRGLTVRTVEFSSGILNVRPSFR
ncbi:MAG: hypothetical protein OXF88_21170 [Rhodobacteraceae bacterium]|nr:hypothetical protein [Paracoccaceae bacterium]MCY4138111.1 hypothetical protein [Paracoccaceae bacterium]